MVAYTHEERARARSTIRRLNSFAAEAKIAAARGLVLPTDAEKALFGLTNTSDRSRQIEALSGMAEKFRAAHLRKLLPLAPDEFNAFCEYTDPDEPPESQWHIYLTDTLERIEKEPGYERFVLNCPPGHAKPLDIDTLVMMGDGSWKRLGDIAVGDKVMTHLGRARKVSAVHEQGTLSVLRLTTKQGRDIIAAPDHSFMMRERHGTKLGPQRWKLANELIPDDLLVLSAARGIENTSGKTLAEFELAAFIAAHGSRTYATDRTKTRTYRNAYLIGKDETVSALMHARLDKLGIKHTRWYAATDGLHYIRIETKAGDALAADYGLDDRADARRVPTFVWRGGDAEVRKYIETYVNLRAECPARYKLPRLNIPFRSREMATDFQRLLTRFAIPAALMEQRTGSVMLVLTHEHIRLYEKLFTYSGVGADRLRTKLNRLDERGAARAVYTATDPLRSIVSAGRRPCRCLTVEEDHTFIANGVVVHNSTYASRKFVAWRLGRRPRDKMIGGGHSQRFVENEFSKKIRDLLRSPECGLGEVLWSYYDLDYFADKRATQSYQRFSLVYQQNAYAANADSIASKLKYYKIAPHLDDTAMRRAKEAGQFDDAGRVAPNKRDTYRRIVLSVDTATKPTERANYTVIQCWGETGDRKHYLLDQKRGKWALPDMTREVNKLAKRHGVDAILIEDKGNGTSYIQEQGGSPHQARKAPAPIIAIAVPANQGKEFRFDEITPMIEAGDVFVPEAADWTDLFVREMAQFPDGANDDQVDALSQYLRWAKTKRTRYGSKKVGSMG
jgi:predicted phage terminase large subunit-like protein